MDIILLNVQLILYRDVPIMIGEKRFPENLIQFDLSEFDVILGMTSYSEASKNGLGCILMQNDKVITYALRQLKPYEKNYPPMTWN